MTARNILSALTVFCFLALSFRSEAQDLQIPASPGMSIIGAQNTEITKPGNYAGVYANLISPLISDNGTIPTDLALEFAPYYLESRAITRNDLENVNSYRDLRVSIASNKVVANDSSTFSRMGIGLRTYLFTAGKVNQQARKDYDQEHKVQLSALGTLRSIELFISNTNPDSLTDDKIAEWLDDFDDDEIRSEVEEILNERKSHPVKAATGIADLRRELEEIVQPDGSIWDYSLRTGHFLELAGAVALDFPTNSIDNSMVSRWGIWLDYTYRPDMENSGLDFSALLRLSNYSFDPSVQFTDNTLFVDFGVSGTWNIPNSKWVIQGEYIFKGGLQEVDLPDEIDAFGVKKLTEAKWSGSLGYRLDNTTMLTLSLSELLGDENYLKNEGTQFLLGISTALFSRQAITDTP